MTNPILEDVEGVTLTSTGLVVMQEHIDFAEKVFSRQALDVPRALRCRMTLNHETIHFIQCFTAASPYYFSLSFLSLAEDVMHASLNNELTPELLLEFKTYFRSLVERYRSPFQNVSTIDLLEAMAVTEGYRATVLPNQDNPEAFHLFLQDWFPDPNSEYRLVIEIVTGRFGKDAGYNLTPRLCYIALNTKHPSKSFFDLIDNLPLESNSASEIILE